MGIKALGILKSTTLVCIAIIALVLIISGGHNVRHSMPSARTNGEASSAFAAGMASTRDAIPGQKPLIPVKTIADAKVRASISSVYGKLPLSFEANRGQTDRSVKFLSRGSGYTLYLGANEATLSLSKRASQTDTTRSSHSFAPTNRFSKQLPKQPPSSPRTVAVRLKFLQASTNAPGVGLDPFAGKSNYFIGNDPNRWRRDIPLYGRVRFHGIYPGINLVYYGQGNDLEFDVEVAPGADPGKMLMQCEGADDIRLNPNGDLVLTLAGEDIFLHKPRAYQQEGNERREIQAGYALRGNKRIQFRLDAYDGTKPLTIDPVLSYATYLGGNSTDSIQAIAVDSSGNAYVAGYTYSWDFPTTGGAFQTSRAGDADVFITKLNPAGSALVFSTFLGGSDEDGAFAAAIDAAGNVYVTGYTASTNFPTTSGVPQRALRGSTDIFVTKLDRLGNQLMYSTYLGGSETEYGTGIAVDSGANATVVGYSHSNDYPIQNAIQANRNDYADTVLTKLNASGTGWIFSTYYGGSDDDYAYGIAMDPADNIFVIGTTYSSNFPTTSAAFQPVLNGYSAAFVAKLPGSGKPVIYSTYLGGDSYDYGGAIAVDSAGNAYVTGQTTSTNFPLTQGAFQKESHYPKIMWAMKERNHLPHPAVNRKAIRNGQEVENGSLALGGYSDAFAAKLNPAGTGLIYSTYLGGSEDDTANAIAIDTAGNAVVTGVTWSPNFPVLQAFQSAFASTYGIYKTSNAAGNWILSSKGLPAGDVWSLAIDTANANIAYAGLGAKGVYKTTDGGVSWASSNKGIETVTPGDIVIDPSTPNTIYEVGNGLWKSANAGLTWSSIDPIGSSSVTCLALDPKRPATLYAGGTANINSIIRDTVSKSTNAGVSWSSPVAVGAGLSSYGPSSIAVDYSNSSIIYVTSIGGPYKSTDGGTTWKAINAGIPGTPHNVIVDPQNASTLYLLAENTVYKTIDGGADWSSLFCCLNYLVIDRSNPKVLYGADTWGNERGVWKSTDAGLNWSTAWTGADKVGVVSLAISASNPALLLAGLMFTPDAFVTQFSPTGTLLFSSFLGGENEDAAWGVAAKSTGIYVAGDTYSERFATANTFQSSKNAGQTAFVAKISAGGSPPGKSTLISPTGTISTTSPTYAWNAVPAATHYLLYVSDSKTQGKINQWYKAADAGCGSGTGTCSVKPTTALSGGSCQWWIQTWNDAGVGPWSDAMNFSILAPPPKATLISPSGNINTSSPAYTWNAASTATYYLLFVNDSKTQGKINQWYKAADAGCGNGTGTCSATPATALSGGSCQWWIQTWNDAGVGPWSDAMNFSILAPPPKATLISPSGNITTSSPTYTWNAASTATYYLLFVNDSKTQGKINQWYKAADAGCGTGTGTCSAAPATALSGGSCQWWIQTWNDAGVGPWSDAMNFSILTPPPKATLISPSGNITTSSPTYTWNAVSTATYYLLFVNDSKTQGKINQWYRAADAGCGSGTGTCSATPSTALAGGSCQWWIQTWNDAGVGSWSDGMAFVVGGGPPGKATLVSPTGTITTATPTYIWNAVTGSTQYLLWVTDSAGSGKVNKWYTGEQANCGSGTGNCSVTPDTALAKGAAQWWIQTWNSGGYGPWSDAMSFTVGDSVGGPNIEFVTVAAGEFQMGTNNGSDESPIHRVIISKSFQLGKIEVTQGQWKAVMGSNPSNNTGDDNLPVERASWDDIQAFIGKLNALNDGYQYRLPTEAEWEYACRAGTTGDYGGTGNLDEMGWFDSNSGNKTHVVGSKKANAWGLYDMHGNVWEWVKDWYGSYPSDAVTDPPGPTSGSYRVARSGSWAVGATFCRSAYRNSYSPDARAADLGFRLLRIAK